MADVFKILFLILGMLICTVSYWLLFASLFPKAVGRTQTLVVARPYRVFMTGAFLGVPLSFIGFAMAAQGAGPLKLLGIFILMSIALAALFGSTGLVRQVGLGLYSGPARPGNGGLTLRGGAVVSIACVFPLVGWFVVIPVVLIMGFGAALQLRWSREPAPALATTTQGAASV